MRVLQTAELDHVAGGFFFSSSFTSAIGSFFARVHQTVETFITNSGLRTPVVTAFDYQVVHPLLWNPLSSVLNYDVANVDHG